MKSFENYNAFDGLERFSDNLEIFIKNKAHDQGIVISLNAPWGNGKTTFIEMWGNKLENSNKVDKQNTIIRYNAWDFNFSEDPLTSLLSKLISELKNNLLHFQQVNDSILGTNSEFTP